MNERIINDLAVKSGLAEDMGRGYKFPDNYLDFAELIVTECAMFVVVELEGQVGSRIADRTANRLEEHFGVEQ